MVCFAHPMNDPIATMQSAVLITGVRVAVLPCSLVQRAGLRYPSVPVIRLYPVSLLHFAQRPTIRIAVPPVLWKTGGADDRRYRNK